MEVIADLHLHSKYSRAVSPQMVIPQIAKWARKKGIGLVGAPDWTHPLFFRELKEELAEVGDGVFVYKDDPEGPKFLLVTEISSIYSQSGRGRRIHTLFLVPSFAVIEKINKELLSRGVKLMSDGRPVTGLSVRELAEIVFSVSEDCLVIPSHLWTPWFGIYGDRGGFDSLKEAYGDLTDRIFAIETGLSSDPAMNWRVGELDGRSIVSFSDAHSPQKLGREATAFEIPEGTKLSYEVIRQAVIGEDEKWETGFPRISYTIEFYPQEGKYHYTGHRKCGVKHSPEETKKLGKTCPVCGRRLTVGVMHRVEELAARSADGIEIEEVKIGDETKGVSWRRRPPYVMLVPLSEILSEALGAGVSSQIVETEYNRLVTEFGSEFNVLMKADVEEIAKISGEKVAEGVKRVREGNLVIDPGYDGVFGTVKIWGEREKEPEKQMALF